MSQQQESSLGRVRDIMRGHPRYEAEKLIADAMDELTDELGRARDMNFSVMLAASLWGAACGFGFGWLVFA